MSDKPKRRLKKEVKIVLGLAVCILFVSAFVLAIAHRERFDYQESLDEIVLTIDDTNISLKELSYYIMQVEATGEELAKAYNANNPLAYWNMYMNDTKESGYVTDLARRAAINFCIRDNIYAKEAAKADMDLTADELSDLKYDAEKKYELMKQKQRSATMLTAQDFEIILYKERLAHKYIEQLVKNDDSDVLTAIVLKYDVDGTYYEQLKSGYTITTNDKIIGQIKVGFITIN